MEAFQGAGGQNLVHFALGNGGFLRGLGERRQEHGSQETVAEKELEPALLHEFMGSQVARSIGGWADQVGRRIDSGEDNLQLGAIDIDLLKPVPTGGKRAGI